MNGGQPGAKGLNAWVSRDGSSVSVGGKCAVNAEAGDRFITQTPGSGAWGREGDVNIQSKVQADSEQAYYCGKWKRWGFNEGCRDELRTEPRAFNHALVFWAQKHSI